MGYRLHHIHLVCSDLEKSLRFFTETLGGKLLARRKFGTADGATIDLAGAPIYLRAIRADEAAGGAAAACGYHHLGLAVDDLDAAHAQLTAEGYVFTTPPTVIPTGKMAFVLGPDNIVIELMQENK
jgi:glyoxylase I family protein